MNHFPTEATIQLLSRIGRLWINLYKLLVMKFAYCLSSCIIWLMTRLSLWNWWNPTKSKTRCLMTSKPCTFKKNEWVSYSKGLVIVSLRTSHIKPKGWECRNISPVCTRQHHGLNMGTWEHGNVGTSQFEYGNVGMRWWDCLLLGTWQHHDLLMGMWESGNILHRPSVST